MSHGAQIVIKCRPYLHCPAQTSCTVKHCKKKLCLRLSAKWMKAESGNLEPVILGRRLLFDLNSQTNEIPSSYCTKLMWTHIWCKMLKQLSYVGDSLYVRSFSMLPLWWCELRSHSQVCFVYPLELIEVALGGLENCIVWPGPLCFPTYRGRSFCECTQNRELKDHQDQLSDQ